MSAMPCRCGSDEAANGRTMSTIANAAIVLAVRSRATMLLRGLRQGAGSRSVEGNLRAGAWEIMVVSTFHRAIEHFQRVTARIRCVVLHVIARRIDAGDFRDEVFRQQVIRIAVT